MCECVFAEIPIGKDLHMQAENYYSKRIVFLAGQRCIQISTFRIANLLIKKNNCNTVSGPIQNIGK